MATANFLAALWGSSLTIVCLALLVNKQNVKHLWRLGEDNTLLLLTGLMTLILGIASVLAYNVWNSTWTVVITILGWATFVKGVAILFLPEFSKKWYTRIEKQGDLISFALVLGVVGGCILMYLGFTY